jgi:hypothetical protein
MGLGVESGDVTGEMLPSDPPGRRSASFLGVVAVSLVVSGVMGAVSDPPLAGAPGYALDSPLVYRLEVGVVFFLVLYSVAVLVRLAAHGLTPSRVGTAAVHLPQLMDTVGIVNGELDAGRTVIDDMLSTVDDHAVRIADLELSIRKMTGGTRSMTTRTAEPSKPNDKRRMSQSDFERIERARANLRIARAYGVLARRQLALLRRQMGL